MAIDFASLTGLEYLYSPDKRLFLGYLALALLIGLAVGRLTGQQRREWLGAEVWWHPSARLDYRYFAIAAALKVLLLAPLVAGAGEVAVYVVRLLDQQLGYRPKLGAVEPGVVAAYALALFLVNDLSRYGLHRLMHRVPALWAIHRVHHGAEVMTPFTYYRVHPLENLLFALRYAFAAGTVTGGFVYVFGAGVEDLELVGVNAFVLAAHLLGDNLRHSHLRLGYPAWLEHLLISPMQHQRHHDIDGNNSNYGSMLAIWDWSFGSLRTSNSSDRYRFGVRGMPAPTTIAGVLLEPLRGWGMRGALVALAALLCLVGLRPLQAADIDRVQLGRALFFDTILSREHNLSCASCHDPARGFSESRDGGVGRAASLGDDLESLGDRNAPGLAYASLIPGFGYVEKKGVYRGGLFWDGRAADLQDQAAQPILNPIEMAMPDKAAVIDRIEAHDYYRSNFERVYGDGLFEDPDRAYAALTDAIATFEKTEFFMPFDSKYDRYLRGEYELTALEDLGMSIFFSTNNSNCASCHQLKVMDDEDEPFTNFEYRNIGTPTNTRLRAKNGKQPGYTDPGLGAVLQPEDPAQLGKFRVPGLRNVAVTGPYMHNGVFRDLRTVIEFYDQYNNPQRSRNPETGQPWRPAEVAETIDRQDLKAKKLSDRKIDALVAFLETLTDRRYENLLVDRINTNEND
jgi:cytochrome c peroxidase/sterol desaturase/sphingolipid hydroxylase (fatty acid hydroxylase superfamily)